MISLVAIVIPCDHPSISGMAIVEKLGDFFCISRLIIGVNLLVNGLKWLVNIEKWLLILFSGVAHAADPGEVMACEMHKATVELQGLAKVFWSSA